ncbi:hypothetical protein HBH70_214960 [Parastagonospora nodorum]|nr:hypothetical protein HBH52_165340 [Parastagonospora nodorum]KAH3972105.1 hypothetical protein HBH51_107840 [Parastagonospora nodorum]KAH4113381.1 hypothetical protein HBH47_211730 [Parastagonospora nodorum]KAH4298428.1 hypothetical protein HBI01_130020 [Parastagonospora nodorum]KAH4317793.1 hypothetical protein HBI02_016100 [Parastagonospora nodorum]
MAFFASPIRRNNTSFANLAGRVSKVSSQITAYLEKHEHAHPDFTPTSAVLPETYAYESLRNELTDATMDLMRLANGPKNIFRTMSFWHTDLAATQVALRRKFFDHVPDDNIGLTASEVAKATSMDVDRANRILKMLATHRIFEEVAGKFRHTALSNFLKTNIYRSMAEMQLDPCAKATSDMDDWIVASPYGMSVKDSPFYRQFKKDFYTYTADESHGKLFSDAMRSWGTIDNPFEMLRNNFDWGSLANTKVVDIGGGNGHVSLDLAREFKNINFTVQDLSPQQLSDANVAELGDRVTYEQYDYYTPQPIRDAGVYLCRATFHNHNDEESVRMLRALIPALEGRTDNPVVLINDVIVPERAEGVVTMAEANQLRQMDLLMLALFGAKERTENDWRTLFKEVDERLEIVKMHYNPRGAGLLEVRLR